MDRFALFLKGLAMGTADVIPGVSGGTLALILGIYKELVDTIKGLSPRIFLLALVWVKHGRLADDWAAIREEFTRLNVMFLAPLLTGIAGAIGVGSVVIPALMEDHPVAMRALFFGLIAASVFVPFRMIAFKSTAKIAIVAFCATLGLVAGLLISNPANSFESSRTWSTVTPNEAMSLKETLRRGPSAMSSEQVYWSVKNDKLRAAIEFTNPAKSRELSAVRAKNLEPAHDKETLKARSAPYDLLEVPAGTPVQIPQPTLWFVFLAGLVAICAMILPGISGSYILLIFGVYFFVLNALKGLVSLLLVGELSMVHLSYVSVFVMGCAIGILSFARVLSYLLEKHAPETLGVLVGLMLGCLRGIWPFRAETQGVTHNVLPQAFDETVAVAIGACLVGFIVVGLFTWLGRIRSQGATINA